jgi:hypothetical protein
MAGSLPGRRHAFWLLTGTFLFWQSKAAENPSLPKAPAARPATASLFGVAQRLQAPEASAKSREGETLQPGRQEQRWEKRVRGDLRRAGRRSPSWLPRATGALSFVEWAARTFTEFQGADSDHPGWLTAAEYATTAPPRPKKRRCAC